MKKKISCKICNTLHCFIRENLSEKWIDIVDSSKQQVLYKEEQLIVRQGEPVAGMYFIRQGKVKVVTSGYQGQEQIVRLATDGHVIGHRGLGNDVYPISAAAMTNSLICFVDNAALSDAFIQNPKFPLALMMFYSRELRKMELRMKYLGQMNVREKIAEALLYIHKVFGISPEDGALNISSCRQEIACFAGINNDQVTKQLKDFSNENLVVKRKRRIRLINPRGLEKIVHHFGTDEFFKQQ
jgi:CRP-like cAMP-binding protein